MQCPRCNKPLEEGEVFCGNCGAQVAPQRALGATVDARREQGLLSGNVPGFDSAQRAGPYTSSPQGTYGSMPNDPTVLTPARPMPPQPVRPRRNGRILLIGLLVLVVIAGGTLGALVFFKQANPTPPTPTVTGQVFFRDGPNGTGHTDALILSIRGLSPLASGSHYQAWGVNTSNEQILPLGVLTQQGQNFALSYAGNGKHGHAGLNLIGAGNKVEITQEQGNANLPTGKIVASATFPPAAFIHIRHLLFSFSTTPHQVGLLVGLRDQAQLLNGQATVLKTVAGGGNTLGTQCLAQSILDIVEGSQGSHFQPLPRLCTFQNITSQGDGFGILGKSGYDTTASLHASLAATAPDATTNIKTHARHVQIATTNIDGWLNTVDQDAQALLTHPGDTSKVSEIVQLCDHAYNGIDIDGDEHIDPVPGEAGAVTAYAHGQLMAALELTSA